MLTKPKPATDTGTIPVGCLSIFDPVFMGTDENGVPVYLDLVYRNILLGGEPGGGKSVALNNIAAHAALSPDTDLWLLDGKQVELGPWRNVAEVFVGNDVDEANTRLAELQAVMDSRYDVLAQARRRKITRADGVRIIVCIIDEIAYFSATAGNKASQEEFSRRLRDLVARGRAAGIVVVAATQRPSADIIPTSLRDIFGYRCAFRCTTEASSDIILGHGWAKVGYVATSIAPEQQGVGLILAEGGVPRRFKAAFLSDPDVDLLVDRAGWIRGYGKAGVLS